MFNLIEKTIICFFIIVYFSSHSYGQNVRLRGTVMDSLKQPLAYANILAEPIENLEMRFVVTDERGRFQLILQEDVTYKIRVSFLGYRSQVFDFLATKDGDKNFVLFENDEQLKEVTIDVKQAVTIKKDTIRYLTDFFVTGEERKLKDVLKKLPGVEVDRAGNVMVNGKVVTKVLVENKQFFTGDSKLAVNNIPADAVNEIEVLDNYSDIAILKGLESSNELAMNVKLKENKKNFIFGDMEVGVGINDKYVVHPSIFFYSPKRSISAIGEINNTGKKSFTFKDYLDFEGGYNKILLNPSAYFSYLNDDFSSFLTSQDFKSSNHKFGAVNLNQSLSNRTELLGYIIYSDSDNQLENNYQNTFINENGNTTEKRVIKNNPNNKFIIGKVGFDHKGNKSSHFKSQSIVKSSKNIGKNSIITDFKQISNKILSNKNFDNSSFKQNLEWYKSVNDKHTFTLLADYNYKKANNAINWQAENIILQDLIPIEDEDNLSITKDKNTVTSSVSFLLKHYWILGNFTHLYTTVGSQFYFDDYVTDEYQLRSDGSENNFSQSGFGNDINYKFHNLYGGLHLKFQRGIFTFKPGLFFHKFGGTLTQENTKTTINKPLILPEAEVKIEVNNNEKVRLNYNLKARFPSITKLANQFTLTNFNSIYQGDNDLGNELSHQLRLRYYKFSMYNQLNYNININYIKKKKSLRNKNTLIGINYITNSIVLNNADESLRISAGISKRFGKVKVGIKNSNSFSKNLQIFNENIRENESNDHSIGGNINTVFENFPNFEISYQKSFTFYSSVATSNKFINDNFQINMNYDFLKDFIFNLNYDYTKYNNDTQNNSNTYDDLQASLFYQKEDSPWGFELTATNIFDTKFKQRNSFSDFLITDEKTFVLPRIILLKVSYKL